MTDDQNRDHVRRLLDWEDAHVGFDKAVDGIARDARERTPAGLPYSLWQVLEHLRRAQRDILEFCRNANYKELKWPDDYWPSSAAPASDAEWDDSVRQFRDDRKALQDLAADRSVD